MLEYVRSVVKRIDAEIVDLTRAEAIRQLRKLGLSDFGEVFTSMPDPSYPNLSRVLPAMASTDVQLEWTGAWGMPLFIQTCAFVRTVAFNYVRLTGQSLDRAEMLDFGCGYGRIARLMYYFTPPERLIGVDPSTHSIELCREAGLGETFRLSRYLPDELPVEDARFDLIYAFSVFTHTSRRATRQALDTLRLYMRQSGLLVITIRPIEFWDHHGGSTAEQIAQHRTDGFAFMPHGREPIDGDVTYGDTSMSLDWLNTEFPSWQVTATDRSPEDPLQMYVFLRPR